MFLSSLIYPSFLATCFHDILAGDARTIAHASKEASTVEQAHRSIELLFEDQMVADACVMAHLYFTRIHDQDPVPRYDGTQPVSDAQQSFALKLPVNCGLDLRIRLKIYVTSAYLSNASLSD